MPISKEKRALYPPNWTSEIVPRIRARDGNCCKQCGVADRAIGYRDDVGAFIALVCDGNRQRLAETQFTHGDLHVLILIVLTCAHLHDPDPTNCSDENLAMLCQRCHNRLDAPMRSTHAAETRREGRALGDLFAPLSVADAVPFTIAPFSARALAPMQAARDRRDVGMTRAVEHADRVDPSWSDRAFDFVQKFAGASTASFLTEQIVEASMAAGLACPTDGRAWGGVIQRASRAKVIEKCGYAPAVTSNGSPKVLWQSHTGISEL